MYNALAGGDYTRRNYRPYRLKDTSNLMPWDSPAYMPAGDFLLTQEQVDSSLGAQAVRKTQQSEPQDDMGFIPTYPGQMPWDLPKPGIHSQGGNLLGAGGYVRERNGNPIAFDSRGNLLDQTTGEKGTMILPEVVIRPRKYSSANDPVGFYRYLVAPPLQVAGKVAEAVMPEWLQKVSTVLSPSRDIGFLRSGKAPWNPENPGLFGNTTETDRALNDMFDSVGSPIMGKGLKRLGQISFTHPINNFLDVKALKKFNRKYNYSAVKPKWSLMFDNDKLDKVFDYTVNRHRTFIRGVDPYEAQAQGKLKGMSPRDAASYSLTHIPKSVGGNNAGLLPTENGLYLSNDFRTALQYTNGKGYVGIVRLPIEVKQSTRRRFLKDNDFIYSRPPEGRQFFWTTDEPVKKALKGSDYPIDWHKSGQPNEIRADLGAGRIKVRNVGPDYRQYIIVGDVGE